MVADAEHGADQPGASAAVATVPAPVPGGATRRAAYVGANDFHPTGVTTPDGPRGARDRPHLGWVHSGAAGRRLLQRARRDEQQRRAREADPSRRDAPGTLALNLLLAGWLPMRDVKVARPAAATVTLAPSTVTKGTRLMVLPWTADVLTVELVAPTGSTTTSREVASPCTVCMGRPSAVAASTRRDGDPPFTDLLQPGEHAHRRRWTVAVRRSPARVAVLTVAVVSAA